MVQVLEKIIYKNIIRVFSATVFILIVHTVEVVPFFCVRKVDKRKSLLTTST